jgi:hypothetical protein
MNAMNFPNFNRYYTLDHVRAWIAANRPPYIAMTDAQYRYLSELMRHCPTNVDGVPIRFLDAPA